MNHRRAAQRGQGLCEAFVRTGPRRWSSCLFAARLKRLNDAPTDQGLRVCGTHARAFTRDSLVEIGSPGWAEA